MREWLGKLSEARSAYETTGNRVELFFDGDRLFEAMREAIAGAENYVHLEMYMFQSDEVGWPIAKALGDAAKRGVEVKVVYDAIGSGEADEAIFASMKTAGVKVEIFRPVAPWRKRSGFLGRNHRKNLIVDGRIAFTGGVNLGREWSDEASGGEGWRDTHLSMEGPGAAACDHFFGETWAKVHGRPAGVVPRYAMDEEGPWESDCFVVGGSGFAKRKAIRTLYTQMFSRVQEQVSLTMPYFVPPRSMLNRLRALSARGVKVALLVPRNSDVAIADWVREGLYPALMESGVDIWEYTKKLLHAKTVVADDRYAVVGSANFDYLSIAMNWELAVVVDDPRVVGELRDQYDADLEDSEKVGENWELSRPWWRRFFGWLGGSVLRRM